MHGPVGSAGAAQALFAAADAAGLIDWDGPAQNEPEFVFQRDGRYRRHGISLDLLLHSTFLYRNLIDG